MIKIENDPILHTACKTVSEESLANFEIEIKPIAKLLIDTMFEHNAYGVSACQIGIDLAMFAMCIYGSVKVCINPQIVAASLNMTKDVEGCLSFPNLRLYVKRPESVVVRYYTIEGQEITEQLDGITARVWLHEYDHCNGICFTDRVGKLSLQMAKKRKEKQAKKDKK
jgi:peptide deformylase